ncbi:MAG: hypothetical protein ACI93T_001101 [Porticoccaceae bacterium]|jgi:hypothetical protein
MTPKFTWDEPGAKFLPGAAIDATVVADSIDAVAIELSPLWNWLSDLLSGMKQPKDAAKSRIVAEIWPDTGRWIFVVSAERELVRVCLTVTGLEELYFALPNEVDEFDEAYGRLISQCVQAIRKSLDGIDFGKAMIVARDADDGATDVILSNA